MSKTKNIQAFPITKITFLKSLQCRRGLNEDTVLNYTEKYREDESFQFPAILLMLLPDGRYVIIDGVHRFEAAKLAERESLPVIVIEGDMDDAVWQSSAANKDHGLPRTMSDKRRAVVAALRHKNYQDGAYSMRDIAKHVGVSHTMVQDAAKKIGVIKQEPGQQPPDPQAIPFPPEVLAAIEKISRSNAPAGEALLTGAILKPHDEILRFSEYPEEYQRLLAPVFFGRRMSLAAAIAIIEKTPTDESSVRQLINYVKMQGDDLQFAFDNNTVFITVSISAPNQKTGVPIPAGAGSGSFQEP